MSQMRASMSGQKVKRVKVVASALALFVLFLVPWHGWSPAVASAANVMLTSKLDADGDGVIVLIPTMTLQGDTTTGTKYRVCLENNSSRWYHIKTQWAGLPLDSQIPNNFLVGPHVSRICLGDVNFVPGSSLSFVADGTGNYASIYTILVVDYASRILGRGQFPSTTGDFSAYLTDGVIDQIADSNPLAQLGKAIYNSATWGSALFDLGYQSYNLFRDSPDWDQLRKDLYGALQIPGFPALDELAFGAHLVEASAQAAEMWVFPGSDSALITATAVVVDTPTISNVSPNPVTGSASPQTITIYGTSFVNKPTLTLTWTGQPGYTVPTAQVTYVSSTQLQMAITTTTTADNWTVKVTNPDGQVSNIAGFAVVAPTPPLCTVSFNTSSESIDASGGQRQVILTTSNASCTWSATSDQAWVHNITPSSGTAGATLTYTVDPNTSTLSRSATIRAGQATLTVSQLGTSASCTFSLGYTTQSVPANGGTYLEGLFASNESCARTAQSNASFITNVFPASGNGSANISYTVAQNTSASPRSGTLTIAGLTLMVNQDGVAVTPPPPPPPSPPGSFTLFTPTKDCPGKVPAIHLNWSASTGADHYDLYRDGSLYPAGAGNTTTSFTNTGSNVSFGATYSYFVRAVGSTGLTTDSNQVSTQTTCVVTVGGTGGIGLKLRTCASTNDAICPVITTLPDGTVMTIFGGPVAADGFNWYAIQGAAGTGWSAGDWLIP